MIHCGNDELVPDVSISKTAPRHCALELEEPPLLEPPKGSLPNGFDPPKLLDDELEVIGPRLKSAAEIE